LNVADRDDCLACLDHHPTLAGLEVLALARRHFLAVLDEVGFDNFGGHDWEIMNRVSWVFGDRDDTPALWGMVFLDLWFCSNFGGRHWEELVARDPANVRYAIEAAQWVFTVSSADGGRALAAILDRCYCWAVAEPFIPKERGSSLRHWWLQSVLPWRGTRFAGGRGRGKGGGP
jgi:hypothetical protein